GSAWGWRVSACGRGSSCTRGWWSGASPVFESCAGTRPALSGRPGNAAFEIARAEAGGEGPAPPAVIRKSMMRGVLPSPAVTSCLLAVLLVGHPLVLARQGVTPKPRTPAGTPA